MPDYFRKCYGSVTRFTGRSFHVTNPASGAGLTVSLYHCAARSHSLSQLSLKSFRSMTWDTCDSSIDLYAFKGPMSS